ncbi:MAG: M48 family metallopeptidase [Lachnospiraceae bacterium]|nr:M48 family metallopeptidase [Lachnospiraceae bacterium]
MGEGPDKGYRLIRSKRRTMAIEVKPDGSVIVRAPFVVPRSEIASFLEQHENWILKKKKEIETRRREAAGTDRLTSEDLEKLKREAAQRIPERVRFYAEKLHVSYGRISIRAQKTRWGSCSAVGSLSFNCLLMLAPEEVLDSVVVHELCHRKEMNHSAAFYREVFAVYPEYERSYLWLKTHGRSLLLRLPE